MSYSFQVVAADKQAAKEKVAEQLAKVVEGQPVHAADRAQAQAAADAFIDLLPTDPARDIRVDVHGSVGWDGASGTGAPPTLTSAGVGVAVYLWNRPAAE